MTDLPIPIPQDFSASVKEDQKISQGDPIATKKDTSSDLVIDVSADLQVDPKRSASTLVKRPGDRVEVGDLLAKKSSVFGSREIRSKVEGTIVKFDDELGKLVIRVSGQATAESANKIISPVDGVVSSVGDGKVILKTDKETILAEEASGGQAVGEVKFFEKDVLMADLDDKVSGLILIGRSFDREAIAKAIGLGAAGIIAEKIEASSFENLREKMITTPVLKVKEESYKKLIRKSGKLIADAEKKLIVKL